MKKVASAIKIQSFLYDFSVDGGAIGSLNTKIVVPNNCIITQISSQIIITIVSAGSTIAIGWASNLLLNSFANGDPVGTVNTAQPNNATLQTRQFLFTIGINPITAGKVLTLISYFESSGR